MTIHEAALAGNVEVVQRLLTEGEEVDARDEFGMTPLHWAALLGQVETVQLLLGQGAEVNARDNDGGTPLGRLRQDDFGKKLELHIKLQRQGLEVEGLDTTTTAQLLVQHGAVE